MWARSNPCSGGQRRRGCCDLGGACHCGVEVPHVWACSRSARRRRGAWTEISLATLTYNLKCILRVGEAPTRGRPWPLTGRQLTTEQQSL